MTYYGSPRSERPDLVVVGPELPLSLGLVDELQRRSIPVFGPTQKAAQLESSKAFAKRFMQRHKIPDRRLCRRHQRAASPGIDRSLPSSGRDQGGWPGVGQGRAHVRDAA